MRDGTRVKYADVATYHFTASNPAVAVIALMGGDVYRDGRAIVGEEQKLYGIGVQQAGKLAWAKNLYGDYSNWHTGWHINFTNIRTYGFSLDSITKNTENDIDGSDNWKEICEQDIWNTATDADIAVAYPAFHWALHYAETAGLSGSKYADGWYIPTLAEGLAMLDNSTDDDVEYVRIINTSLAAIGVSQLNADAYWTASQIALGSASDYDNAYAAGTYPQFPGTYQHANAGALFAHSQFFCYSGGECDKASERNVFVIRAFDIQ